MRRKSEILFQREKKIKMGGIEALIVSMFNALSISQRGHEQGTE